MSKSCEHNPLFLRTNQHHKSQLILGNLVILTLFRSVTSFLQITQIADLFSLSHEQQRARCSHGIKTISRRFVSQITHVTFLRKFSTSFFCCSLFKAEIIKKYSVRLTNAWITAILVS